MNAELGVPGVVIALRTLISQSEKQMISFRDYMQVCLYHEADGYYRSERPKIGKEGDFYTSSSIGTVMGEMVASFIYKQENAAGAESQVIHLVEWGGGTGRLALHVLDELKAIAPALYEKLMYTMIESSSYHRGVQRHNLAPHLGIVRFMDDAKWFAESPCENVYVLANELLDAFPVHRVQYKEGKFYESFVHWHEQSQAFQERWLLLDSAPLLDYIERLKVQWIDGQIAELNLDAEVWIGAIAKQMHSGSCIMIDYGDRSEELYAAHRHRGTLMCYRNHQAHDNPFVYAGGQDITSHVNFSMCMSAVLQSGFTSYTLETQREFLVEQGILDKLRDHYDPNPFSDVSKRNRAIRQLLLSDQMSELFKVFIATKKR
ncbi:class I SAM-dependent methyltransferase [Paenibacillus sp. SI8]|uniref:class I SAM-dependent methyltransferase n=1 Tax=unclassified Paenibacillus TaxID=185978 RepID=UPI0034664229